MNINGDLTITGESGNPGGLRIDVDTINNNATLLADNATVRLESSNIDNTNGVIEAQNGATVELADTLAINGGLFRTDGTSVFSKAGGNVTLTDITLDNNSRLEVRSNQQLDFDQVLLQCQFGRLLH